MPILTIHPSMRKLYAESDKTIFSVLRKNNIPIGSSCGGDGICDKCRVTIMDGKNNLSEMNEAELRLRNEHSFEHDERVACQTKIHGDVMITTGYW